MVKTIKISDENYQELVKMAGTLQSEAGKPVPIDGAVHFLLKNKPLLEAALLQQFPLEKPETAAIKAEEKDGNDRWTQWRSKIFTKKRNKNQNI